MARSISSQKRLRQGKVRGARNKARRTLVKSAVRKVNDAIQDRKVDDAEKALREATKVLDRYGTLGTVHPKAVARRKSRLAKQINALKATPS